MSWNPSKVHLRNSKNSDLLINSLSPPTISVISCSAKLDFILVISGSDDTTRSFSVKKKNSSNMKIV